MTTLTVAAAELARIVKAVEKSAAKDDSRPVLAGITGSGGVPLVQRLWAHPERC